MDIDNIRTLLLVARHGSFAAAARVLDVDPSSVSRTIAALEEDLGLRLFQRTTRKLSVTEEGALYISRIGPLIEEFDQARDEAARRQKAPAGTLRMTASVAFTQECIVPYLGEFSRSFPEITVELLPSDANMDLVANDIDLAFRLSAAPTGDLISSRVMQTRYRVVCAPDYIAKNPALKTPQDLSDCACLRFALPDFRSRWLFRKESGPVTEVAVGGRVLISNALALRQAARDGLGPVLLADWLVNRDLKSGRLVDLFPDWQVTATEFDTGAWALYPSRSFLPQKVRAAIDFFRPRFARLAGLAGP